MAEQKEKQPTQAERIDALEAQVEKLSKVLCQVATLGGYGNYLRQHGLEPWTPSKADMSKFK